MIRFEGDIVVPMSESREAIYNGTESLSELCARHDLRLVTDAIGFVSHWITPLGEARRFDTRFLLLVLLKCKNHCTMVETIDSLGTATRCVTALESRRVTDVPPTVANLEWLTFDRR